MIEVEELEPTSRNDFRRANGAPMIVDRDGKSQRFSRPSSYAKPLDDESALVNWRIDRAAIGVAHDRALAARWVAIDPDDKEQAKAKKELREASISAGRGAEAADIGTALHAMSVRWEQGDSTFHPPEPFFTSLTAYTAALESLGLVSDAYEFHIVNEQYRCAGTADRLYRLTRELVAPDGSTLPVGTLLIGDLKTGGKMEYSKPGYAVQMTLYAEGEWYDVIEEAFIETPKINQDWGMIVHLPAEDPGVCEFQWVDFEIGRWGCYLVDQIKRWRRSWRSDEFTFPIVSAEPSDEALLAAFPGSTIETEPAVVESTNPPSVEDDGWLTDHVEWAKLRLHYIAQHPEAKALCVRLWPAGIPTPKQGVNDRQQMETILDLLSVVESEFSLGFVEGGPQTSGHRSTLKG